MPEKEPMSKSRLLFYVIAVVVLGFVVYGIYGLITGKW